MIAVVGRVAPKPVILEDVALVPLETFCLLHGIVPVVRCSGRVNHAQRLLHFPGDANVMDHDPSVI